MARQYDRHVREENRKYTVLRLGGKRARPVAAAPAKVEVLDSIKDVIRDESESSDSSSEADDEGDGDEETHPTAEPKSPIEKSKPTDYEAGDRAPSEDPVPDKVGLTSTQGETPIAPGATTTEDTAETGSESAVIPVPPVSQDQVPLQSPLLDAVKSKTDPLTPPMSDMENGIERNSILKALTGLWPQQPHQVIDDAFGDPEHIFRDSDMVVRLDEPTSIIALALK